MKIRIINYYEHKAVKKKFSDYFNLFKSDIEMPDEDEPLRSVLDNSLVQLPERCQETVRLRIDENLSLEEIANRMNIDKGSVKRYLTMALNYFK